MHEFSTIAVIGTGYVGMACALAFSEQGFKVVGHDIDAKRIAALQCGVPPYNEDGLEATLAQELAAGRLRFTTDLAESVAQADAVFICVNTPTTESGEADLNDLYAVVDALSRIECKRGAYVVVRSTVPPGTSDDIARRLGDRAEVLMTPEFLREGFAMHDSRFPSRHVIGAGTPEIAARFAAQMRMGNAKALYTTRINAELTKLAANAFLAMKITFANEVANLTEAFNGDARDVLQGIGLDDRIGRAFLSPGIGFGGPCFSKDLHSYRATAIKRNVPARLVSATLDANFAQPLRVVEKLERELRSLSGATIGVWGLTFKAGTNDVRHSLATGIITELCTRGARVRVFDPQAANMELHAQAQRVGSAGEALAADALLVLTEWPEFATVPVEELSRTLKRKIVVDGRNLLDGKALARNGVRYFGIGVEAVPVRTVHGSEPAREQGRRVRATGQRASDEIVMAV